MANTPVTLNSKQELYDYLNKFDFKKYKTTHLDSTYFLVKYINDSNKEIIEPLYFFKFEDVWFESDCDLHKFDNMELLDWINLQYGGILNKSKMKPIESYDKEIIKYESIFHIGNDHYEIMNWQVAPFLPNKIEILDVFTEKKCLDYLIKEKENYDKMKGIPYHIIKKYGTNYKEIKERFLPKYKIGETVSFKFDDGMHEGKVWLVDIYGTFGQDDEPSYDIENESENMLYKHIRQSEIIGLIE